MPARPSAWVQALADLNQPEIERLVRTVAAAPVVAATSSPRDLARSQLDAQRAEPTIDLGQPISRKELAYQLLVLAVVAIGYMGFAKMIGNGAAAMLFWFMGTIYVALTLAKKPSSFPPGNVDLLALAYHAFLLALPIGAAMVLYFLYELAVADREEVKRNIFAIVFSCLMIALRALITGRRR